MIALTIMGCILLYVGIYYLSLYLDIKNYNNGKCTRCGNNLKYFMDDSLGRRGYRCECCGTLVWVSFDDVDEKGE